MKKNFVSAFYVAVVMVVAAIGVMFARSSDQERRLRNIAGGGEIDITVTPWQVSMLSIDPDSADADPDNPDNWRISGCGGSIIAPSWILTADHCVKRGGSGALRPEYQLIGVGNKDFWPSFEDPYLFRVSAIYPARENKDGVDLLLLKLTRPIKYSATARPIALPVAADPTSWPEPGTEGTLSGWGQVLGGTRTTKLRAVSSPVIDSPNSLACTDQWGTARFDGTYSSQRHICIRGVTFSGESAGACPGDSGGPLAITVDGIPTLAGVASMALGVTRLDGSANYCTGMLPNLYARLLSHIDWVVPGPPQDLRVKVSSTNATISWTPAARVPARGASDYVVEIRSKGSLNFAALNDGVSTKTTASLTDLQVNTEYEIRVAGVNEVNELEPGNRRYSQVTSFTVGSGQPDVPVNTSTTTTTLRPSTTSTSSTTTTLRPSTTSTSSTTTSPRATSSTTTTTTTTTLPKTRNSPETSVVTVPDLNVKNVPDLPAFKEIPTGTVETSIPASPQRKEDVSPPRPPVVGASMASTDFARYVGVLLPSGSQVAVLVARGSTKICSSNGVVVKFKASGKCKVGISVRAQGKQPKVTKATIVVKRR